MAITSASTITEIEADILDNGDYDLASSISKAKLFIHACRAWLVKRPRDMSHGSARLSYSVEQVTAMVDAASSWLQSQQDFSGATTGTSFADMSEPR